MKKKIAIIQRTIPHYRIDFFAQLCRKLPNAVIFHSTKVTDDGLVQNDNFHFPNQRVEMIDCRCLCFQRLVWKVIMSDYEFIIMGLELRIISNLIIWLFSYFKKTKIIWWTHGYNVHIRKKNTNFYIDRIIKTFLMKRAYKILLYTEYNIDELLQRGIDRNKLIVLNNTINEIPHQHHLDLVTPEMLEIAENKTRKSDHSLMFIGRLIPAKRADLLLEVVSKLMVFYADLRLLIIGDGEERARLEKDVQTLGLANHIFFLGTINDPASLAPYMKITDFNILPGAVGLSLVHSMICGIPFVTLRDSPHSPEIAYLKNDYTGYMATDVDDMIDWLHDCFEHPTKITSMKNNCRTMIKTKINMAGMVSRFAGAIQ